jgi:hypothetical protein
MWSAATFVDFTWFIKKIKQFRRLGVTLIKIFKQRLWPFVSKGWTTLLYSVTSNTGQFGLVFKNGTTVEPRFMNAPVHEQIFRAKVSDDERCLGLRTRKLATAVGDKLRVSAQECQLLVNFGSVHIPA